MKRSLASVQQIAKLSPIDGADQIERADILGWHCVVRKGDFKEGDLCIFFEIDSVIPRSHWSDFLFKNDGATGYRLKTVKLRGQVSQGLAIPITQFFDTQDHSFFKYKQVGDDLTKCLGVVKYEPNIPAQLRGKIKGNFPGFIRKTDEIRIQACPNVLERWKGHTFLYSEKLDGSSMSIFKKNGVFGVCSRNIHLKLDADDPDTYRNAFGKCVKEWQLDKKMDSLDDIAIQGELIGPGIQKNKYKLSELQFRAFQVYDIKKGCFESHLEFLSICRNIGIYTVPILGDIELNHSVDDLVEISKGVSILENTQREGVVFRPYHEETDPKLGRLSFKVINPDFLLKNKE